MTKCISCKKEIKDTEVFGDPPNELCWDCYSCLLWDNDTDVTYNFVSVNHVDEWLFHRIDK